MKNDVINQEIRRAGTPTVVAAKLGCCVAALYRKMNGERPWKVSELLELSRLRAWTKEQFLNIIEFDGYEKED